MPDKNGNFDNTGVGGDGVFQLGATAVVPYPGLAGTGKDIFDYIATNRRSAGIGYSNPVFGGMGWNSSGTLPYPRGYKIHCTSYSNFAFNSYQAWTVNTARPTPGASPLYTDHNIYDFMGALHVYTYLGKTITDNCLIKPSIVSVYNTSASNIGAFVWGSNNGVKWDLLGTFDTTASIGWKNATCQTGKFYRYLRVGNLNIGGSCQTISGIELFGTIKFVK